MSSTSERTHLCPSILSADFAHLEEEVRAVERSGASAIHLDVMDGHFVPNLTIGPAVVKAVDGITALPLDVHLMIQQPDQFLESFRAAGADQISVHVEAVPHLHRTVSRVRAGADFLVAGNAIFGKGDPAENVADLLRRMREAEG